MNDEKDFGFKDEEINKVTSDITKENKHQFGKIFKDAIKQNEGNLPVFTGSAVGQNPSTQSAQSTQSTQSTQPAQISETVEQKISQTQLTEPEDVVAKEAKEKEYSASVLKTLRTYERDMAEAIRSKGESVTSINLAKQKKQQENVEIETKEATATVSEKTEKVARGGLTILVSLILIIAGTGVISLIYYFVTNRPAPVVPATASIISTDEKQTLDISALESAIIQERILAITNSYSGSSRLIRIELVESLDDVGENKLAISAERFFELVAVSAPATLGRALGGEWVFGFYKNTNNASSADSANTPFIFSSVDSFDNAFDGMLRWENKMIEDLSPLFVSSEIKNSTALGKTFEDKIIRNKDTRILKDNSGNIILLYSFVDQKNLVVTTNEQAFQEILNRFFSSQIVR